MPDSGQSRGFRPRAVLLDFYGTVVQEDDAPIASICAQIAEASESLASLAEIGEHWGSEFSQLCYQSIGDTFRSQKELERTSLELVLARFGAKLDPAALSQVLYEYWRRPAIFPEAKSVLARCGVPVCLVSNIDNSELDSALRHNGLAFEFVVTSEDCRAYKPRAEMFEKALAMLGLAGDQVLCVGDSLSSDVRGAKEMGIPVLWINRKRRSGPSGDGAPAYVSDDLSGLLAVLNGEMHP